MVRKLLRIEAKLDRVLELLENQEQRANESENRNREFLRELLEKKTEIVLNEWKDKIEVIEAVQRQCESKISDSIEQNTAAIKELCNILNKHDKAVKKTLISVQQSMDKEQGMEKELAEKMELTESEIRLLLLNSVMDQLPL